MKVKALSLWQPWATLIAIGAKRIETRSWSTRYRGPLAIHAAKTTRGADLAAWLDFHKFRSVFHRAGYFKPADFPLGAIVALCRLSDVWRVERIAKADANRSDELDAQLRATLRWAGHSEEVIADSLRTNLTAQERAFGDYSPDRWGWFLDDIRPAIRPVPIHGHQGLFDVEVDPYEFEPLIASERKAEGNQ